MKFHQLFCILGLAAATGCSFGESGESRGGELQATSVPMVSFGEIQRNLEGFVRDSGIKAVPRDLTSLHLADMAMRLGQDLCDVPERLRHDEQVVRLYIAHNVAPKTDCLPDEFRGRSEAAALPVSFRDALIPRESLTALETAGLIVDQISDRWNGRQSYQIVGVSNLSGAETFSRITNFEQGLDQYFEGGRISGEEWGGSSDGESLIYAIQGLSGGVAEALRRSLDNLPNSLKRQIIRFGVELYARYDQSGHYASQYVLPFSWQFVNQLPDRSTAFASDSTLERAYWAGRTTPIQVGRVRVTHDQWVTLEWMKRRGPVTYNMIREELRRRFGS